MARQEEEISYWQMVSRLMDLEDQRLRIFVQHRHSLGVGREHILRRFLSDQTPEPFRVSTGFVVVPMRPSITSDQCDILVYDPRSANRSIESRSS